jgi:quinol-cytochrome oxidoreductase complex cytochrome b subunit
MMSTSFQPTRFLRYALIGDAVASGATGLLMAAGAGFLTGLLNLPEELLRYAGMFLLPYALIVAYVGTRPEVSKAAVWAIIAINALWAVESIGLLVGSWVAPTMLGYAFVIFQAVVVLAFAEAQYMGLRQARSMNAAAL